MKVSVVVLAFNEEDYLGKCLDAIFKQTKKPFEVIVVDNNSTDKTAQIAKKKGAKVVFEKKQGASYARERGFNAVKGDIILRTDADTIVPKNWVLKMTKGFEDKDVGIVCGGVEYYGKNLNLLSHLLIFWIDDVFGYRAITGPNFGIRKNVWDKVKKEVHTSDNLFHEDLDLSIHAQRYGKYVRDYTLMVKSSSRKFSDFNTFFINYPQKWINTVFNKSHRKLSKNPLMRF